MTRVATGRPGRPAAATREAALALATKHFLAGERIDVQAIARELGLEGHQRGLVRGDLAGNVDGHGNQAPCQEASVARQGVALM